MIENIKQFVNEHRTLIAVIITVLVICFLYRWLCCKDRPSTHKIEGGGADYKTRRYYDDEKGYRQVIGTPCESFDYNGKQCYMIVLNLDGIHKLVNEYSVYVDHFFVSYLTSFFQDNDEKITMKKIIGDSIGRFTTEATSNLNYGGESFDFKEVVASLNGNDGRNEVLNCYSKLFDEVIKPFHNFFDTVSFVGQLGRYPLPNFHKNRYPCNLLYSQTMDGLFPRQISNTIFESINNPAVIRDWYSTDSYVKNYIVNEYFNDENGLILNSRDIDKIQSLGSINGELCKLGKILEKEQVAVVEKLKIGEIKKRGRPPKENSVENISFDNVEKIYHATISLINSKKVEIQREIDSIKEALRSDSTNEMKKNILSRRKISFKMQLTNIDSTKQIFNQRVVNYFNQIENDILNVYQAPNAVVNRSKGPTYIIPSGYQVADVYPAYKLALTVMFLVAIYPAFIDKFEEIEYMKMIASYVLCVNSFNINCNVKMDSSWNDSIHNEYVYEKINVFGLDTESMNLTPKIVSKCEIKCLVKYIRKINETYPNIAFTKQLKEALDNIPDERGKILGCIHRIAETLGIDLDGIGRLERLDKISAEIEKIKNERRSCGNEVEKSGYKFVLAYIRDYIFMPIYNEGLSPVNSQDWQNIESFNQSMPQPAPTHQPPAPTHQPPAPTQQPPAPTQQPPAPTQQPPAPTQRQFGQQNTDNSPECVNQFNLFKRMLKEWFLNNDAYLNDFVREYRPEGFNEDAFEISNSHFIEKNKLKSELQRLFNTFFAHTYKSRDLSINVGKVVENLKKVIMLKKMGKDISGFPELKYFDMEYIDIDDLYETMGTFKSRVY